MIWWDTSRFRWTHEELKTNMRSSKQLANRLVSFVLPYLAILLWPVSGIHHLLRRKSHSRRILLVARNMIAADHLVPIYDLLSSCEQIELRVTCDRVPTRGFNRRRAEDIIGARSLHVLPALICHWDLIIFTNHTFGFGLCFPPWLKKLYINHGLHTGKINNDKAQDGVYGHHRVIRPFDKPFYHKMFAASTWEKEFAIRQTPLLRNHITVVGFLKADQFLVYARDNREVARKRLGYTSNQKLIHIISTWGEQSLYAVHGQQILQQIADLQGRHDFVVSIHPRYNDIGAGGLESRDHILARFEQAGARINRNLDWRDYIVASDATLSDHSSLCLYHVLLGHPTLLVDVDQGQYVEGSIFDMLSKQSKKLSDYANLGDAIQYLLSTKYKLDYEEIRTRMLDYSGSAASRYREEIEMLLDSPGLLSKQ